MRSIIRQLLCRAHLRILDKILLDSPPFIRAMLFPLSLLYLSSSGNSQLRLVVSLPYLRNGTRSTARSGAVIYSCFLYGGFSSFIRKRCKSQLSAIKAAARSSVRSGLNTFISIYRRSRMFRSALCTRRECDGALIKYRGAKPQRGARAAGRMRKIKAHGVKNRDAWRGGGRGEGRRRKETLRGMR